MQCQFENGRAGRCTNETMYGSNYCGEHKDLNGNCFNWKKRRIIMGKPLYYKDGRPYRKLKRDEHIEKGAMHSWCLGELMPITNNDDETIGNTPSGFSAERDFYNMIHPSMSSKMNQKKVCNRCLDYREAWHTNKFTCPKCGERWVLADGGPGSYWETEKEYLQEQRFVENLIENRNKAKVSSI